MHVFTLTSTAILHRHVAAVILGHCPLVCSLAFPVPLGRPRIGLGAAAVVVVAFFQKEMKGKSFVRAAAADDDSSGGVGGVTCLSAAASLAWPSLWQDEQRMNGPPDDVLCG